MLKRPMPKIILSKPSDEVRQKRIKLIHVPAVLFKLTGVRRTRKCIYNWMMTGKRVYTGKDKRAILGHEKIMGEYYTTRGDIESFLVEIAK